MHGSACAAAHQSAEPSACDLYSGPGRAVTGCKRNTRSDAGPVFVPIIGAGTFGAPISSQAGIPLQYNLLTFDPDTGDMTVQTRKKEKPNGAWSADARWGDKKDPKPWYRIQVPNYQRK